MSFILLFLFIYSQFLSSSIDFTSASRVEEVRPEHLYQVLVTKQNVCYF